MPIRTTTTIAIAATTDFNNAFADKRLNIRTALQESVPPVSYVGVKIVLTTTYGR
jgi:hypothetical protein